MQNEHTLHFNRASDCYEATIVIKVEAEIFQRTFFRYVEEHSVDVTDPEALQKAVNEVSQVSKWVEHPRAQKVLNFRPLHVENQLAPEATPEPERPKAPKEPDDFKKHVSREDAEALREKALALPVDEWETLLTPLPQEGSSDVKNRFYQRRHLERKVLEQLKQELETPLDTARTAAIAGAVNSVRFA